MKYITKAIIVVLLGFYCNTLLVGQTNYLSHFEYLSPLPNSKMISPENQVTFRLTDPQNIDLAKNINVTVVGYTSGNKSGKLSMASDDETFIFKPDECFAHGEEVEVIISNTATINPFIFSFNFQVSTTTKHRQIDILNHLNAEEHIITESVVRETNEDFNFLKVKNDSLPAEFADISITNWENPSDGYIFMAPFNNKKRQSFQYIVITDNFATPVFYSNIADGIGADFKMQPTGDLTFYSMVNFEFYKMNTDYDIVDTIVTGNGYTTDVHELIIQENGHSFLMAYDPQIIDMSLIVEGGNVEAEVIGLIIQELDASKNVIFQWRSWDHFEITDASDAISLVTDRVDYAHGNAIEVDTDTSLMISCRNMDEITRINRLTGDIIWRLGGKKNMFAFSDSSNMFCKQHDIRVMPNSGNLSLFDNGNCHDPQYSSAAEYSIDLTNMTAELVERLTSSSDSALIYGAFMGNAQRLENENTVVGWGSGIPSITEYNQGGDILLQFSYGNLNYRAFKFDWETTAMSFGEELVDFGTILHTDSLIEEIHLTNNYHTDISINKILNHQDIYSIQQNKAVDIAPGETAVFNIWFKPTEEGTFNDVFTFCWDIHTDSILKRVAKQIQVTGTADFDVFMNSFDDLKSVNVFPNPVADLLNITSNQGINSIRLLNSVGELILQKQYLSLKKVSLEFNQPSGLYFIEIISPENIVSRRKVIKH